MSVANSACKVSVTHSSTASLFPTTGEPQSPSSWSWWTPLEAGDKLHWEAGALSPGTWIAVLLLLGRPISAHSCALVPICAAHIYAKPFMQVNHIVPCRDKEKNSRQQSKPNPSFGNFHIYLFAMLITPSYLDHIPGGYSEFRLPILNKAPIGRDWKHYGGAHQNCQLKLLQVHWFKFLVKIEL